jgi:hypothetical protein
MMAETAPSTDDWSSANDPTCGASAPTTTRLTAAQHTAVNEGNGPGTATVSLQLSETSNPTNAVIGQDFAHIIVHDDDQPA